MARKRKIRNVKCEYCGGVVSVDPQQTTTVAIALNSQNRWQCSDCTHRAYRGALLFPLEHDSEEQLVRDIKRLLLTDQERMWLHAKQISIEDMLNGRVEGDRNVHEGVAHIFQTWNEKIGRRVFGG